MTDFLLTNSGSTFLLTPITPDAAIWIRQNLPKEAPSLGRSIALEPQRVTNVVNRLTSNKLTLNIDLSNGTTV